MSTVRFNQLWIALLLVSVLGAFVIPQQYSDRVRNVQAIFAPIAWPTRKIASIFQHRFGKQEHTDPRAPDEIVAENQWLKSQLLGLQGQLDEQARRDRERDLVGDVRPYCTPVSVMGVGTDGRDSLLLAATFEGIKEGQAVLYPGGLAGRIQGAGAGARVRLVTDLGFTFSGWFVYYDENGKAIRRDTPQIVMRGVSKGEIKALGRPRKECEKLREGDIAVLDDPAWPKTLIQQKIGTIVGFEELPGSPMSLNVRIKPVTDLISLREVMVMTKER